MGGGMIDLTVNLIDYYTFLLILQALFILNCKYSQTGSVYPCAVPIIKIDMPYGSSVFLGLSNTENVMINDREPDERYANR